MQIHQPGLYHIYNRGNNKQKIFFNEGNYVYFLRKCHQYLKPVSEILAWCLMPNHFHCMLVPNEEGCKHIVLAGKDTHMQNLSKVIGKTLSSYTKALNVQNKTTGNLFQKKTKAKLLTGPNSLIENFSTHEYVLSLIHI